MVAFTVSVPLHSSLRINNSKNPLPIKSSPSSSPSEKLSRRHSKISATAKSNNEIKRHQQPQPQPQPQSQSSAAAAAAAAASRKASRRSLSNVNVPPFNKKLLQFSSTITPKPLSRTGISTLQVNIGLTCNLACRHCHVESSPSRKETMPRFVVDRLVEVARASQPELKTVDVTGGAPEIHEQFQYLISQMSSLGLSLIHRCNLSALLLLPEQGMNMIKFLADHHVKIVASLPCYSSANVEKQRGKGVFLDSIHALQMLNSVGYGQHDDLQLDLVYNPIGPTLPPPQQSLESDYKQRLKEDFNIDFNHLVCITNMPIKRFADDLAISDKLEQYVQLLEQNFNPNTVKHVMCANMVHVSYDGAIYDCDFNYALDMGVPLPLSQRDKSTVNIGNHDQDTENDHLINGKLNRTLSVFDINSFSELVGWRISTDKHCYGCTAGSGSSCGGTLT